MSGQTNRRRRTSTPIPAPTATPLTSEPQVISRADEFPDANSQAIPPDPNEIRPGSGADTVSVGTLEELGNRIKNLEAARNAKPVDPDEKQKRLLLNLDILTRAESRSESLRKQVFEMIEKENTVKTKIDSLQYDLRPEVIERSTAMVGSLRPEEIRESRKKSLESERLNLQNLLTEIQRTRSSLEISLQRADALVEKLRAKFEKEIDSALEDDSDNSRPEN
jgi:predicted  nucleic acid-binding Zn-ribbon protein